MEVNLEVVNGDEIKRANSALYKGDSGKILLSNTKVYWVKEKGLFKKTYDLVLEIPYDQIEQVSRVIDTVTLTEDGKKHVFQSDYATSIEENIKRLSQSMMSVAK